MKIGNCMTWCQGKITRTGKGEGGMELESAIDWMVFSGKVERRVVGMEIDEDETWGQKATIGG